MIPRARRTVRSWWNLRSNMWTSHLLWLVHTWFIYMHPPTHQHLSWLISRDFADLRCRARHKQGTFPANCDMLQRDGLAKLGPGKLQSDHLTIHLWGSQTAEAAKMINHKDLNQSSIRIYQNLNGNIWNVNGSWSKQYGSPMVPLVYGHLAMTSFGMEAGGWPSWLCWIALTIFKKGRRDDKGMAHKENIKVGHPKKTITSLSLCP